MWSASWAYQNRPSCCAYLIPGGNCVIPMMRTGVSINDANQNAQTMNVMASAPWQTLDTTPMQHWVAHDLAIGPNVLYSTLDGSAK